MIPQPKNPLERREVHVVAVGQVGPPGPAGPQGVQGIPGASVVPTTSVQNSGGSQMRRGCPVAQLIDGTVVKADAVTNPKVMGFVFDEFIEGGAFGLIQTGGLLDAAVGDWETATNVLNGLVASKTYFLSTTPGEITTTPDTNYTVAAVGRALSTTRFFIDIEPPVL